MLNSFWRSIILVLVVIMIVVIVLLLLQVINVSSHGFSAFPLLVGMLGDPFRTTRNMKIPPHGRKGHRERRYIFFMRVCIYLMLAMILLLLVTGVKLW